MTRLRPMLEEVLPEWKEHDVDCAPDTYENRWKLAKKA